MFFGELKTESSLNGILTNSMFVKDKNNKKIKVHKGTVIKKSHIELFLKDNINSIICAKLEKDDVQEDKAVFEISKEIVMKKNSNLTIDIPKQGRCNLISNVNGVIKFDPKQLLKINSVTDKIAVASKKNLTFVKKNQVVISTKAIPFAIDKITLNNVIKKSANCFQVIPFKHKVIHLIQTQNETISTKILEKTIIVTKDRLIKYGINNFVEKKCEHSVETLSERIKESIDENADIILIFGASAITDINDIIPKSLKLNHGKIKRLGMPVEPGNLMLLGNIKTNNKNIDLVGMPGCARSPKENGVDWILWRLFSELGISKKEINNMGNGGLL
jgi:molybdenum cofactor cytidylyltransferase